MELPTCVDRVYKNDSDPIFENLRLSVISLDPDDLCFVIHLRLEGRALMARVTVEDCLANVDSRFTLVHLAVRRVLQLRHGVLPALENVKGNKEVVLALREIAAGRINAENIHQIEESRPLAVEQATPEADAERADLQEIIDEVSMYGAPVEFGSSDGYFEEGQAEEGPQGD